MNVLTFDIEEWAIANTGGYGSPSKYAEYDGYLSRILDLLEKRGLKATFFCTGMMASDFPLVVKLIHSRRHEIGCHSYRHTWMNKMTEAEAREDTHAAVDALEQCISEKVRCYRAPAFSIGESNKWMFEILAENGIECDASIFPAARDFGGFANFGKKEPCIVEYKGIRLKEFPICTTKVLGKEQAYSGGGYFRFFPYGFIEREMKKASYSMTYFHLGDLLPVIDGVMTKEEYERYFNEPGTGKARYLRYIKTNLGVSGNKKKLFKLLDRMAFSNIEEANRQIDWGKAPVVEI